MEPKAFQLAAIDAAVRALNQGSRRFLLADEVGLGKTVVAREAIWRLAEAKKDGEPFRVFYVSSNQTLSAQNAPRLVRDDKRAHYEPLDVSRPSLLANGHYSATSTIRVQLFRFSPETALPILKSKPRSGVMAERALLFVLRARVLKWRLPPGRDLKDVFRGRRVRKQNFSKAVRIAAARYRNRTLLRGYKFSAAFLAATRTAIELKPGESLQGGLDRLAKHNPNELLGRLRLALTMASLECLPPDLIVFDEFHRYQDKAFDLPLEAGNATDDAHRTFLKLLPEASRPRLLLLSATPFKFTQVPGDRHSSRSDAVLFHRLVGFLHGDGAHGRKAYEDCREAFADFAAELAAERFSSPRLMEVKARLEDSILRPRMARMERVAFASMVSHKPEQPTVPLNEFPKDQDIHLLAGFASGLRDRDKGSAVTFWRSIPLPHQTMGSNYAMWANAPPDRKKRWRKLPGVSIQDRNSMRVREEAYHPKFRELLKQFPPERLALPWLAPSSPWWPLKGPWATSEPLGDARKGLLFSHYRAVPAAVAGLISLAVEEWSARRMRWKSSRKLAKRAFLPPKALSNILLFHPSAWLAANVDPTVHRHGDRKRTIAAIARELRGKLPDTIRFAPEKTTHRPLWQILSLIEQHCPKTPAMFDVWKKVRGRSDQVTEGLHRIVTAGGRAEPHVSSKELHSLAWFALTAPGTVLLRRVARRCSGLENATKVAEVAALSWNGFRSYFDQPWFFARLSRGAQVSYPAALQMAIYEGNFEACLDEHFWLGDPDNANWFREGGRAGRLESLTRSLSIRAAPVVFHLWGAGDSKPLRLAAHAALPLTVSATEIATDVGEEKLRADDLRHAFNTPFWPHLLCTTSVGQEGLDFHQWCESVIHWDLPGGPIEFEQREGRVDRFKSLAVRRAIMRSAKHQNADGFRWDELECFAESLRDATGLRPWWTMEGAEMRRIFLDCPSSDERARKKELARLRDLYRLVLGMPNQWQLLARLAASDLDVETARRACLNLAAWRMPAPAP